MSGASVLHTGTGGRGRRVYRLLLRLYPRPFRQRFADDMIADFDHMAACVAANGGGRLALWRRLLRDLASSAPRQHLHRARRVNGRGGWSRGLPGDAGRAARGLALDPVFTIVVVVTLAIGFGPTTAAYSLARWVLFRPLPGVVEPERLGFIWRGIRSESGGISPYWVTYTNLEDIAARAETLAVMAGVQRGGANVVFADTSVRPLSLEYVTASYFTALGLRPQAGRFFTSAEDDPLQDGAPVAVVSHRLAATMLGGLDAAAGARVRINGRELAVIGVMPRGFHGPERLGGTDLWIPGAARHWLRHLPEESGRAGRDRGIGFFTFVARLTPGASWQAAEAELNGLGAWLAETYPEANASFTKTRFLVYPGIGTAALGRDALAQSLWLIGAVVACILAIACANATSLILIRGLDRRGQVAVQKALGASTGRLVRQGLLESLLLCGAGGLAGASLGRILLGTFEGARLRGLWQGIGAVPLDGHVAGFVAALLVIVALVAASFPALQSARVDPVRWLARAALTRTDGGGRTRAALAILQLAASVPLIVGALLFAQTLAELSRVELGFDPEGIQVFAANVADQGLDDERIRLYYERLLGELSAAPDIETVALAYSPPLSGGGYFTRIQRAGAPADEPPLEPQENQVTGNYFAILGIDLLRGRTFDADEVLPPIGQAADVVVLSASMAERLFGTHDAVGETVEFPGQGREGRSFWVVGVVEDIRSRELTAVPEPLVYVPAGVDGAPFPWMSVVVRARGRADEADRAVQEIGKRIDPLLPVLPDSRFPMLADAVHANLSERRLLARLLTLLSAGALLLAAIGLYGTLGRSVAARTREIGLRKALGADAARTLAWVLHKALRVLIPGAVAGCLLAAYGTRLVESRLYGVGRLDPLAWALGLGALFVVSLAAAMIPARRAARIDPAAALRGD